MKAEAIREFYVVNGDVLEVDDNLEIFESIESPIYEVIRVIKGVPLFLEEHLSRMYDSANIINYKLGFTEKEIRGFIKETIVKNKIENLNIKLIATDVESIGKVFMVYCIESFYPPNDYYLKGINTVLYNYERKNPNAKVLVSTFKEDVTKVIKQNNSFEALLVTDEGYIPEGSRSNVFFVKGEKLFTAPKKDVLLGITRKHVFKICESLNIKVIEESINKQDLNKLEGVFISGTSVNILPISYIGELKLDSVNNKILTEIIKAYNTLIDEYISNNKNQWI